MVRLKLFENVIYLSLEYNFIDLAKEILDEIDGKLLEKNNYYIISILIIYMILYQINYQRF